MTSNPGKQTTSVLPLNARTARIAAGGGLASCSHDMPAGASANARRAGPAPDMPVRAETPCEGPRSAFILEQQPKETTIHHN